MSDKKKADIRQIPLDTFDHRYLLFAESYYTGLDRYDYSNYLFQYFKNSYIY